MSQCEMILHHLLDGKSISAIEALNDFGCFRLAARIDELRNDGYDIRTEMVENKATGKRFARYWMPKDEIERIKDVAA
ncbi:helix-turn-helix domain-containing protein [Hydrogenimonas urashimensis]|uniref:helix-turn-helix domain-containing protein n=1 Tax=Hydrogenimonas urashimensis TaxID=2740515 RepID=UPI001915034E|nr:helix-turn-helix domain-containing protein [Hydrogenimonas urashimensis]